MKVNSTEFGSITIDGETYHHDVLIRLSGKIDKRKKKLSKKQFGTSHIMSLEEAEFVHEKGSELLVLGTGQNDNVRLSPEAAAFFARKGCEVLAEEDTTCCRHVQPGKRAEDWSFSRHMLSTCQRAQAQREPALDRRARGGGTPRRPLSSRRA